MAQCDSTWVWVFIALYGPLCFMLGLLTVGIVGTARDLEDDR